jgi:hypothetical protein
MKSTFLNCLLLFAFTMPSMQAVQVKRWRVLGNHPQPNIYLIKYTDDYEILLLFYQFMTVQTGIRFDLQDIYSGFHS